VRSGHNVIAVLDWQEDGAIVQTGIRTKEKEVEGTDDSDEGGDEPRQEKIILDED